MNKYVIIGNGDTSPNIIEDCLADLPAPRMFFLEIAQTSQTGLCRVYDWLLDNNEDYVGYYNENAPSVLVTSAFNSIKTPTPVSALKDLAETEGSTILYLWNEEISADCTFEVTEMVDRGLTVLDLTQGLTPFLLVDEPKKVEPAKDVLPPLTRSEYESMSVKTLQQQARAQGLDVSNLLKADIINKFLGQEIATKTEETVTLIIVYADKTVTSLQYPLSKAQSLVDER